MNKKNNIIYNYEMVMEVEANKDTQQSFFAILKEFKN